MPERLLTLKEAAEYLHLTPGALYAQRHRGEKPGVLGIRIDNHADGDRPPRMQRACTRGRRSSLHGSAETHGFAALGVAVFVALVAALSARLNPMMSLGTVLAMGPKLDHKEVQAG